MVFKDPTPGQEQKGLEVAPVGSDISTGVCLLHVGSKTKENNPGFTFF